tara:strand:- start:319 stop:567 length:249 start_codon:yes stop_codon:yes gene_type:complete
LRFPHAQVVEAAQQRVVLQQSALVCSLVPAIFAAGTRSLFRDEVSFAAVKIGYSDLDEITTRLRRASETGEHYFYGFSLSSG